MYEFNHDVGFFFLSNILTVDKTLHLERHRQCRNPHPPTRPPVMELFSISCNQSRDGHDFVGRILFFFLTQFAITDVGEIGVVFRLSTRSLSLDLGGHKTRVAGEGGFAVASDLPPCAAQQPRMN